MANLAPFPLQDRVTDESRGLLTESWRRWVRDLWTAMNRATTVIATASVRDMAASIPDTALLLRAPLQSGTYRISSFARYAVANPASQALVSVTVMSDGISRTLPLYDPDSAATALQSGQALAYVDAGTTPTYAVAYAPGSGPGLAMSYHLDVVMEVLP